jgi:transposase
VAIVTGSTEWRTRARSPGRSRLNVVLAEVPNPQLFSNAKQLAAYAGLAPKEIKSGDTIRGRTRLSKTGRGLLRSVLSLPAVSSRRYNPIIQAFADRLLKNGKPHMKVVGASMRRLLHIIFGVLKSGKPFCADYAAA